MLNVRAVEARTFAMELREGYSGLRGPNRKIIGELADAFLRAAEEIERLEELVEHLRAKRNDFGSGGEGLRANPPE